MGFTNVWEKLNKYGINGETVDIVMEQNESKAEKVLHNMDKLDELIQKVQILCEKARNIIVIGEIIVHIPLLCRMVRDYINGSYTALPIKSVAMIVVGLIYFVNPCDIIADYIPMLGMLDDGFILGQILNALQSDIQHYEEQHIY